MHYLSFQYLFGPAGPNFRFVWPAVLFFLFLAMASTTYAYYVGEVNNKRAPLTRTSRRVRTAAWIITLIGLILIGFREGNASIPLAESRFPLYVTAFAYVVLGGYLTYFLRVVLPKKNAAYEMTLLRRQYMPRRRRR
ncbi:MAG: hypothetical protein ACYDAG_06275 [Chloroflexota bacterium]